jgi:hypothetical protein
MHTVTDSPSTTALADISLVRGGAFFQFQQAVGLIRPNQWNIGGRSAVLIAIGWLPLLAITALLHPGAFRSLLTDYRVYVRLFIAIPVLLSGEIFLDSRFRTVLGSIRESDLLEDADTAHMDGVMATIVRLRDSLLPEFLILAAIMVFILTSYHELVDATPWLGRGEGSNIYLTTAGWYGILVGGLLWNFLLALGLWHWLLWTFFAFNLSKRNLKIVATHPDGHGGIGFLGLTGEAFAPIAFVVACVIGATWRQNILHHGTHVMSYKVPAIVLAAIIALAALGPLFFFVPRLFGLRRRGIREYGALGHLDSSLFHEKWIAHRGGHEAEFLQAPETSRLSAFGQIYEKSKQLKPFPVDKGSLYVLAFAVVLPLLPAVLTEIPFVVIFKDLLKALR